MSLTFAVLMEESVWALLLKLIEKKDTTFNNTSCLCLGHKHFYYY